MQPTKLQAQRSAVDIYTLSTAYYLSCARQYVCARKLTLRETEAKQTIVKQPLSAPLIPEHDAINTWLHGWGTDLLFLTCPLFHSIDTQLRKCFE